MVRKVVTTVLLIVMFPVIANAAGWFFNTWVKTSGGTINSRNMANQDVTAGSIFRSYTTQASLPVTVTANTGYTISNVTVNGTVYSNPASPYTTSVQGMTDQSVLASFTVQRLSVTASASSGGSVSPTSIGSIYYGYTLTSPLTFSFTPQSGFYVASITGTAGATVSPSVPAATNTQVRVTYPTGYRFTGDVALYGTFASVNPIAVAGPNQIALVNYPVTLTASYIGGNGTPPTYTWSQLSGPVVALAQNGNIATFTPAAVGTYVFQVTLDTGSSAQTTVTVTSSLAAAERAQCQNCHTGNGIGPQNLFTNWSSSQHEAHHVMCYDCHVGTNTAGHPGQLTSHMVDEHTFLYTSYYPYGSGSFCLNGTCHNPGIIHKTAGMTCDTCHNGGGGEIHNPNATFAGSLNVCFNCHGGANSTHYYTKESLASNQCTGCHNQSGHNPAPLPTVPLAHFNGYTSLVNPSYAAAYVTARTACSDCHSGGDPAAAGDLAIKQYRSDWGASGHGDTNAAAWKNSTFANWKATGTPGALSATNSGANDCVRCHTTAGFRQYLDSGSIQPVGSASDHSAEPLSCAGCHNADFTVRDLPAVTAYYNYSSGITGKQIVSSLFPDQKESNVCIPCHAGRANGDTIKAIAAKSAHQGYSTSFWQNLPYLDGHHLAGAAFVFQAAGYRFPGQSYDSPVGHVSVGSSGNAGSCVSCHMPASTHSYQATASAFCNNCHTSGNLGNSLPVLKANFASSLSSLQAALTQKGFPPVLDASGKPAYPYFTTTNWGGSATAANNMGAAQNFMALTGDPGAYAHNPTYVKRLIRDSLDWLLNGSVDRSRDLTEAIGALPVSSEVKNATAAFLTDAGNGSAACIDCHAGSVDLAGNNIVTAYNASKHATAAGGASCGSCHAPGAQLAHPSATMLTSTAEVSAKCAGCHPLHTWASQGICTNCHNGHNPKAVAMPYPHFTSYTTAAYLSTNYSCANCHNATDENGVTTFNIYSANKQWARSGKASPTSASYVAYDFKALGSKAPASPANSAAADCVRCHTTTGYVNYVSSSFKDIHAWGISGALPGGDRTREMVHCAACHNPTPFNSFDSVETDDFGYPLQPAFSRRVVPQVTAYYNYSAQGAPRILKSVLLPDQGESNNCIVCHSGTRAGSTLKLIGSKVGNAGSYWSNTTFIAPHGMAAAGVLFAQAGYNYPTTRYRSYVAPVDFVHPGIDDPYYGGQGACVACHLYTNSPHLFSPISTASNGAITKITAFEQVCSECHSGGSDPLDLTDPANLQAKKDAFASSLKALAAALAGKGIYYNPELAPYFFKVGDPAQQGAATVFKNWNMLYSPAKPTLFTGCDTMGAAFNLRLLWTDGGAYAHNDYYAKRLIYDSLDFLDDSTMNSTVYLSVQNLPVTGSFTQDDKNRALSYIGTRP
ncbi:MAG TPA: hypothetical protein VJ550_10470 [Geomonas sp.]|nr:hypothetical protein [Geomonas sp.]